MCIPVNIFTWWCWLGLPLGWGLCLGTKSVRACMRACVLHACHHAREFYCSMESRRKVCRKVHASLRASQFHHSRALSSVVPKAGLQNGASLSAQGILVVEAGFKLSMFPEAAFALLIPHCHLLSVEFTGMGRHTQSVQC